MGRKQTVWILQVTNWWNGTREDLEMAKKGKLQKRNGIFYNTSQNNAISTNCIKVKIKVQMMSKTKWLIT